MKEKIFNLLRATKLKEVILLSSGVFFAQFIGIITQPIVTRLYSAEMFGKLALITALVSMFSPILTLKYDQLIVSVPTEEEANTLTALSLYVGIIATCIFSLGVLLYNIIFPNTFENVGMWIYFSVPLAFTSVFIQIITMYNNRYEQYKLIASVSVIRSILSSILKIGLGLLNIGFIALIISSFVSICFGVKRQAGYLIKNIKTIKRVSKTEMIRCAKKHRDQPLFSAPGLFVNTYSYSVLPLFITALYGAKETGFFSQSMTMLGLPLTLISASTSQVFFRNASKERAEKGNFYSSFKHTTLLLSILSIVPFIILWFFAEPLFSYVFGAEWVRSGTFVKLLIPMYFVRFTVTALTEALIIAGKQKLKLIIQCIFVLEVTVSYIIAKYYGMPIEEFITIINYSYLVNYLLIFCIVMNESKRVVLNASKENNMHLKTLQQL